MPTLILVLIGGIFAGGVTCIAIAVRSWRRTRRRLAMGGTADGTVVALVPSGDQTYVTVFEFRDRQGRHHHVSSKVATNAPEKVGDRVLVSYEPENPDDAEIAWDTESLVGLGLVGAFLALMAVLLWFDIWIGALGPPATG